MHDVVVVGAGTAGCYTSFLLAKQGLDVVLLDKGPAVKERIVCTGVISKEAYKRFSLPEEAVIREIGSFKIFAASGESFRYEHNTPFANVINREYFQEWLQAKTRDAGVRFMPECFVCDFAVNGDRVNTVYLTKNGSHALHSKIMVLATGVDLPLLAKVDLEAPSAFLQGIQMEAEVENADEVEIYLGEDVAPKSFAWCVPLSCGKAKIGLTTEAKSARYLEHLIGNPLLKERFKQKSSQTGFRFIPYGMSKKSVAERVLAVGDAAGQVKTTTGGGIYYSMICSELAAETILHAFSKDDFSERRLHQYEKSWQKVLKHEIQTGILMRRIFSSFNDDRINAAISLANSDGVRPLIMNTAQFDWQSEFFLSLLKKSVLKKLF